MANTDLLANTPLKTAGGIPYRLQAGYPTINAEEDSTTATEVYLIRASDAEAFYAESMPPPGILFKTNFLPPRRRMPGSDWLVTKSLSFKPHDETFPWDPFGVYSGSFSNASKTFEQYCLVTIEYEASLEAGDNERNTEDPVTFLERTITAGGQFLAIPSNKTRVVDGDVNATEGSGFGSSQNVRDHQSTLMVNIPTVEFAYKWKFVPSPNFSTIFSNLGKVNSNKSPMFFDAEKETVLFTGISAQQNFIWNGAGARTQPWTIDFKFSQRIVRWDGGVYGWNHIYNPHENKWQRAFRANGGSLYESFNIDASFR